MSPSVRRAAARSAAVVTRGRSAAAGRKSLVELRTVLVRQGDGGARASEWTVSTREAPGTGTMTGRQIAQPGDRDFERRRPVRAARRRAPCRHGPAAAAAARRPGDRRAAGCRARCSTRRRRRGCRVLPRAQFHLHRRNLGDAPRLLDLSDGDVAQADRLDDPSRFNASSARTLVDNGTRGSGACN